MALPQIYKLLTFNYVEDDDMMFRFGLFRTAGACFVAVS